MEDKILDTFKNGEKEITLVQEPSIKAYTIYTFECGECIASETTRDISEAKEMFEELKDLI